MSELEEIVRQVADTDPTYQGDYGDIYCMYCNFEHGPDLKQRHDPTCAWLSATAWVDSQQIPT